MAALVSPSRVPPMIPNRRQFAAIGAAAVLAGAAAPRLVRAQDDDEPENLFISPCGQPFRARPGAPYPVVDWFRQANKKGDGQLTHAEFTADAAAFFDKLDLQHAGVLDPLDIEVYERQVAPEILGYRVAVSALVLPGLKLWRAQFGGGPGGAASMPVEPQGVAGPTPDNPPPKGLDEFERRRRALRLLRLARTRHRGRRRLSRLRSQGRLPQALRPPFRRARRQRPGLPHPGGPAQDQDPGAPRKVPRPPPLDSRQPGPRRRRGGSPQGPSEPRRTRRTRRTPRGERTDDRASAESFVSTASFVVGKDGPASAERCRNAPKRRNLGCGAFEHRGKTSVAPNRARAICREHL